MFRYLFMGCIALLAACQQTKKEAVTNPPVDSLASNDINDLLLNSTYQTQQLTGIYTGQFDGSPISISVNYISGKNVSGYNVHKGLKRNMRGTLAPMGSMFKLMLDEPGDNKFDGHFDLFIDTASYTGQGTWTPRNDTTLGKKTFTIARRKEDYEDLATVWGDTLNRTLDLKYDGAAVLSYFENKGTPQEQLENISGNWQHKGDSVVVFWQPNPLFPSRRSAFFIKRMHSENDTSLYIDGLRGERTEWFMEVP